MFSVIAINSLDIHCLDQTNGTLGEARYLDTVHPVIKTTTLQFQGLFHFGHLGD